MREFEFVFKDGISKGLQMISPFPKNQQAFIQLDGMMVEGKVLNSLETLDEIDVSSLGCSWPFPQIFALKTITLVCSPTTIYEYTVGPTFTSKIIASQGTLWTCADFHNFIVLSNRTSLVVREGGSGLWKIYSGNDIPAARCVCNLNGQLIVGGLL